MDLTVERVNVWAAPIEDKPGGLAKVLAGLKSAGANLQFVIARRNHTKPDEGVVFVTPLAGDAQTGAAAKLGFNVTDSLHSLRVEGADQPGLGAELTAKLADAGINLRGLSAAVLGVRFVMYLAFDNEADADKAAKILKEA